MAQQQSSSGPEITGHFALVYPGKYIKAPDLHGRDVTVIIDAVHKENLVMVGGKRDQKAAITMRSLKGVVLERKWIVGKTVLSQIAETLGTPTIAQWKGQKVTMYPTTCRGQQGKTVECIRVRVRTSSKVEEPPEEMTAPADARAFVDEAEDAGVEGAAS